MPTLTVIPSNLQVDVTKHHIDWDQIDEDRIIVAAFNSNDLTDPSVYFTIGSYDVTTETWSFSHWFPWYIYNGFAPLENRQIGIQCYKGSDDSIKLYMVFINGHAQNNTYPVFMTVTMNVEKTEILSLRETTTYKSLPTGLNTFYQCNIMDPKRKLLLFKEHYSFKDMLTYGCQSESGSGTFPYSMSLRRYSSTATAETYLGESSHLSYGHTGNGDHAAIYSIGPICLTRNQSQSQGYFYFRYKWGQVGAIYTFYHQTGSNPTVSNVIYPYTANNSKLTELCRLNHLFKMNVGETSSYNVETKELFRTTEEPLIGTVIKSHQLAIGSSAQGVFFTCEQDVAYETPPAVVYEDYKIKTPLHMYIYQFGSDVLDTRPHITKITYAGQVWDKASPYLARTKCTMTSSDKQHVFVIGPLTKTETDEEQIETEKLVFGILDIKLLPDE